MVTNSEGWFFCFRGNWYGPIETFEAVIGEFYKKHSMFPNSICYPIYANVTVGEDKQLLSCKRNYTIEKEMKKTLPLVIQKLRNK